MFNISFYIRQILIIHCGFLGLHVDDDYVDEDWSVQVQGRQTFTSDTVSDHDHYDDHKDVVSDEHDDSAIENQYQNRAHQRTTSYRPPSVNTSTMKTNDTILGHTPSSAQSSTIFSESSEYENSESSIDYN